jgi:hypothetical protein
LDRLGKVRLLPIAGQGTFLCETRWVPIYVEIGNSLFSIGAASPEGAFQLKPRVTRFRSCAVRQAGGGASMG